MLRKICRGGILFTITAGAFAAAGAASAGKASVLDASVVANSNGTYAVSATLFHKDEGWSHYADKFDVLSAEGTLIGTRVLYHPHVTEQPFTRSIGNLSVPIGATEITIRAHDSVHGDGERTFKVKLPRRK